MNVWESDVKYHTAKPRQYTVLVDEALSLEQHSGAEPERESSWWPSFCVGQGVRVSLFANRGLEPPGSSVHGVSQARGLAWVTMPSSRGPSQPRDRTQVSHVVTQFFTVSATREPREWVAYPFSRGSSQPRYRTRLSCIAADSLPAELPGKPTTCLSFLNFVFYLSHFSWPQPPEGCVPSY